MPNSYYFCPFEQMEFHGRTVYAARVLLHLHGEAYRAYRAQPARAYCLAVIENPTPETTAAIQAAPGCTAAGLNCVPFVAQGIRLNTIGGLGYNHDLTPGSIAYDHDITPPGRPSWVTWFRHYGH